MAHIICDRRPDGTATYTINTPRWDVVEDGEGWRILTTSPGSTRRERSARLSTASHARQVAHDLAESWLKRAAHTAQKG